MFFLAPLMAAGSGAAGGAAGVLGGAGAAGGGATALGSAAGGVGAMGTAGAAMPAAGGMAGGVGAGMGGMAGGMGIAGSAPAWSQFAGSGGNQSMGDIGAKIGSLQGLLSGPLTGVIGAIGSSIAAEHDANRKHNQARIAELQRTQNVGLTGQQRSLLEHQMFEPVRANAASQMSNYQRMMAAQGGSSPAALAGLRQQQDAMLAQAATQAGAQLNQADFIAKKQKEAELEARMAAEAEYKRALIGGILGSIAQGLGLGGQAAGQLSGQMKG